MTPECAVPRIHCRPSAALSPNSSPFWMVADVAFSESGSKCAVQPIYADVEQRTPYVTTKDAATTFAPAYPALP